jgi:hypothetical protein
MEEVSYFLGSMVTLAIALTESDASAKANTSNSNGINLPRTEINVKNKLEVSKK